MAKKIGERNVTNTYTEYHGATRVLCVKYSEEYLIDGKVRLSEPYFKIIKKIILPEFRGNDVCCYCGQDNGPNGEYRNGFDCCHCGGN
jgi:hypothetical protein